MKNVEWKTAERPKGGRLYKNIQINHQRRRKKNKMTSGKYTKSKLFILASVSFKKN